MPKSRRKLFTHKVKHYRQAVRTQLIAGIAGAYYSLLMLDAQLKISEQTASSWKETVNSTRALMNPGAVVNETAVSQMEATYYSICTSILDLKEQINQVENSLVLLLADTPHTGTKRMKWKTSNCRNISQ